MENQKKIAEAIRRGRQRKNLTQESLSKLIGKSVKMVNLWESGRSIPSGDVLLEVAKILDIVQDLFPGYAKTAVANESPPVRERGQAITRDDTISEILERLQSLENRMCGAEIVQANGHGSIGKVVGNVGSVNSDRKE